MSRRVTSHLFCSLNGVVENPNLFQFDAFGPEEGQLMATALAGVTDVVIGRRLWDEWSQYWRGADDPFAAFINPVRKHVLSRTAGPADPGWNSTFISGDPLAYIEALRNDGDGGIVVPGGVDTVRYLFLSGAIDALTLTIHPVVTNEGRRLFDDSVPLTRLTLLDSAVTGAGNAILTYGLRR